MTTVNDRPECDRFNDHRRAICRGEREGVELSGPNGVNAYRKHWGLPPLGESSLIETGLEWLTCHHRGEPVGSVSGTSCGCDRTIYKCDIHVRCLKKLPTAKTRESLASELDGVTICSSECSDWRIAVIAIDRHVS